jgi:DNA repair protein RecO (recombination protein O)
MVYGISKKKQSKLTSFQALFLLNVQIYYKANRNIQKVKEYKLAPPLINIVSDIRKSSLAIFLSEVISKTVKEEFMDKSLFDFIKISILFLEELEDNISFFHLVFLIKLSKYLGFYQEYEYDSKYYDYKEGVSLDAIPNHNHYMNSDIYKLFVRLNNVKYNDLDSISINFMDREVLLDVLLDMYKIHIFNFNTLKSYSIFKEVFEPV